MARTPKKFRTRKFRYRIDANPPLPTVFDGFFGRNYRNAKTWLKVSRRIRAYLEHQDNYEWVETTDWKQRKAWRYSSPKLMTIHKDFDRFSEFAAAYWDLVPVAESQMLPSLYPETGTGGGVEWFVLTKPEEWLGLLTQLKRRSWYYLVDGVKTYDIEASVDEAVPNFDQDPRDYIETYVSRQFDSFEVAWPNWQRIFREYLANNREAINELIRESKGTN